MKILFTVLSFIFLGCSNKQRINHSNSSLVKTTAAQFEEIPDTVAKLLIFKQVADYPEIKDTTQFIKDLRQLFNLQVEESQAQKDYQLITVFSKVKIYGSGEDYYFIEYDWKAGSMASCPWKNQLILTAVGKPIKFLSAQRFEFVKIFPHQNPFLLALIATAKGNGVHEIYKVNADTLENVYEGYYDYAVQTYDAHQDLSVFEPNELKIHFSDENRDGFNDIIFTGQKLMLGNYTKDSSWYDVEVINGKNVPYTVVNPAKKIPVRYLFLYDRISGHFKAGKL